MSTELILLKPQNDVSNPELSIVIPAANEQKTIQEFIRWCQEGIKQADVSAEILIVSSSTDETEKIALECGARVLVSPRRGLGRAYIDSLKFIRGKYVLLGDADCTYDFREIDIFLTKFRSGYEFIMGSRYKGDIEKGIPDVAINDQLSYTIRLEKEGYLTKVLTFNYTLVQAGRINVHETLDLTMDKVDLGLDLTTIIDINPIYFDLGKFAIRPDAAIELDKIVKVMNENPGMQIE